MLFYWSLWPEPINTKVKGQQLGNNDSILMMFVHVCVYALMRVPISVCVSALMYKHNMSISTFTVCVWMFLCAQCSSVGACICVCADMCIHARVLFFVCVCVQPLSWGSMIYDLCYDFHRGHIKLQNGPLLPFFFV